MFFKRISVRIGLWYSGAFLISALVLYLSTTYLLMHSLQQKDRDLLMERSQEYALLFSRDGIAGLRLRASSKEIKGAPDFIVRLAERDGKTLFIYVPEADEPNEPSHLTEIEEFLSKQSGSEAWFEIPSEKFGDSVEVVSTVLPTGELLQVGKDTEDREAFIDSYSEAFLQGTIPVFLLAIFFGGFLSNRLLKPIRSMTQTVQMIRAGELKARVKLHDSTGELLELGLLFNQMLDENERLLQGMRDTVDNVAHDLRTPVMRLQNAVECALRGPEEIARLREALIECQENSEMILKLVDGIMDISEADAGTLKLKIESISAVDLVEGVVDLYAFVAEEKNISIETKLNGNFKIPGDRMRLLQVLANLVDNAIKYSPEGSKITLSVGCEDRFGIISVKDEGIGISAEHLPRIWERLYRIDSSRSTRGLGLGLSLVKAIMHAHGGLVSAEPNISSPGTTFSLEFRMT